MDKRYFSTVLSALVLLGTSGESVSEPTTYAELYSETYECGLYFSYMAEGLHRRGATEESVDFYAERASDAPWALSTLGEIMSPADQRSALKQASKLERQFKKKLGRSYSQLEAIKAEYDARCIRASDNFDATAAAIRRGLERQSGEPFADLKSRCVTVSTGLMTATGRYMGMIGPSVKEVRKGGLAPIPSRRPGDNLQILLPRGTVAEWEALPIPEPPEVHVRLLRETEAEQAEALGKTVQDWLAGTGRSCTKPVKPYFRGLDNHGRAHWSITCSDGTIWPIYIEHERGLGLYQSMIGYSQDDDPDPYQPCRGRQCFTTKPEVSAMLVFLPYADSVQVRAAPAERCAEMSDALTYLPQFGPPRPGDVYGIQVSVIDSPACGAASSGMSVRTIELAGERELDVVDIDIGSMEVPGLAPDMSSGSPCELLHGNATVDGYADLRCSFVQETPASAIPHEMLTISGRFVNGARFAGAFAACQP